MSADQDDTLSPQDDAAVSALLAEVGGPTPMPPDVVARIEAALAAERADGAGQAATVTPLVPSQSRRRSFSFAGIAAVAAGVALVGAIGVSTLVSSGSGDGDQAVTADAGGGSAASRAATTRTTSGQDYSPENVAGSVGALLSGADSSADSSATAPESAPNTLSTENGAVTAEAKASADALVQDDGLLVPCLDEVTGGTGEVIAVDAGTFGDEAAVAVVLAAGADAVDVFVVTPDCSDADAKVLYFERVPTP